MVKIKVDLKRREKLRRLHTATHILNYSARKVLGNHVWQNGSNLKENIGSLDITHYDNLNLNEIFKIERLVNETIIENKLVRIEEMDRGEAEKKYGFILYQGGAIPMKKLRIVSIVDSDIEACGGIHMQSTGGIGLFKILNTSKIQDGVVRINFVVKDFAFDFIEENQKRLEQISKFYSVGISDVVKTSEKFFNEWKSQKKKIEDLSKTMNDLYYKLILDSNKSEFILDLDFEMAFLLDLFNKILFKKNSFKLVSKKFILATNDFEIKNFKKKIDRKKFKLYIL